MLKYVSVDVVFQEIPDEVTLAINISGCPNRCEGCHSPWLWEDIGELLNEQVIEELLNKYGSSITCLCFMGGDADQKEIVNLAEFIRNKSAQTKIGWYSGRDSLPDDFSIRAFDYIKLGRYNKTLGGLDSKDTNQHIYRIENQQMKDIAHLFNKSIKG